MDDREPTPRAGPCIEDTGIVEGESASFAYSKLYRLEYNIVDLLIYTDGELEAAARVFVSLDCLELLEIIVKACGDASGRLLRLADEPEVSRVSMEKGCVELHAPGEPPERARRLLEKLGITGPLEILAYKPIE